MTLIYQTSKDGFNNTNFHEICDKKIHTVILIVADDIIFGGFKKISLDERYFPKITNKGFIFYLNEKKIYFNKRRFLNFGPNLGPYFPDAFYID